MLHKFLARNLYFNHPTWVGTWVARAESLWQVNSYPFVVKVGNVHRGQGKFLIKSWDEWANFPEWEGDALVEPYFEGTSIRALVIQNKVWGIRTDNPTSWIKNSPGAEQTVCSIPSDVKQHALRLTKVIGLDIAGVDYVINKKEHHFLEINQFPGLGNYHPNITDHAKRFFLTKMDELESSL